MKKGKYYYFPPPLSNRKLTHRDEVTWLKSHSLKEVKLGPKPQQASSCILQPECPQSVPAFPTEQKFAPHDGNVKCASH